MTRRRPRFLVAVLAGALVALGWQVLARDTRAAHEARRTAPSVVQEPVPGLRACPEALACANPVLLRAPAAARPPLAAAL